MRFQFVIAAIVGLVCKVLATDDGLTDLVTWDKYSLNVNGSRVFINCAEFHYQRLPVPELWPDIFQKLKANGFNAISIYFFWSYHSPSKGVYDFESPGKNVQQLFDMAREAGLWVVARAGPYCNAETNGGGLALWGSDGSLGNLRTSDNTYYQAWLPWVQKIGKLIADNQITNGGPVILNQIENELQETVHSATNTLVLYMEQIEAAFRDAGVAVPFTHNEKGMRSQSWSTDYQDVGGAVNVYGLDSYPGGLSCTNTNTGFNVVRTYYQWFSNYSFTQPSYLPEFEGGWFSAWGSSTFYDQCQAEHDPAFADVYYKNNIGQRVTMQSIYMTFGGTNWGHSAAPVVYTSYDYSAPLRETRQQQTKLLQTKLVNMFASSSPDLLKTYMVGNGTGFRVSSTSVWSWVLKNPDTGSTFTVIQQASTPSTANVTVSVSLDTSAGMITVPDVSLYGRQSKILVTDYTFGNNHTLLYSSSDVLTYGIFDTTSVLVMYLKAGQTGQFALKSEPRLTYTVYGSSAVYSTNGTFTYTQAPGATAVKLSSGVLIYLLEQQTAWTFWAPPTTLTPYPSAQQKLFILGPYLVRSASVSHQVLHIVGDSDTSTTIEACVGPSTIINTIDWNGVRLPATKTPYGSYTATIPGAENRTVTLPSLSASRWHSADSLPEVNPGYDDSRWRVCNKTATLSPVAPLTLPVLFSSDYGFYVGPKIYRGYFSGSDAATAVNITASGGLAFGWNAWLNGVLIGGHAGGAALTTTNAVLDFPEGVVLKRDGGDDNVLTVLVDYHGHDETSTAKGVENPRGILGAALLGGQGGGFKTWKIQGNAGGSKNIDAIRGPMNEGGLYAERLGWFLPGFSPSPSSGFDNSSPMDGISGAGVRFYTTTFHLNLDSDLDVPLGIALSSPAGTVARVMLWVNGYQYGKYVPHIGPQTKFPIPPGVINNRGENTLAISLWAQTDSGARLDAVELVSYGQYQTGFEFNQDWSALQPGWSDDRSQYA
ncbi:family 35 glycosyl hydrolase [Diplogelasinospora grovesii]|uniref:beta-galactosidase n=1 Tax=Diplogelasinospora grovesii TaxID=303347 RepID=A0AAN6N6Z5_9PEZI|nr:family 35 glycosyl hydrolase [Diplogelasinospora grovesii]